MPSPSKLQHWATVTLPNGAKAELAFDDEARLHVNGRELQQKSVVSLRWFELMLASVVAIATLVQAVCMVVPTIERYW